MYGQPNATTNINNAHNLLKLSCDCAFQKRFVFQGVSRLLKHLNRLLHCYLLLQFVWTNSSTHLFCACNFRKWQHYHYNGERMNERTEKKTRTSSMKLFLFTQNRLILSCSVFIHADAFYMLFSVEALFFSLYWASFDDINRLQSSSFWSFWINSIVFLFIRSEFFFGLNSSYWIKYFIRHFSSFYIILHCLFGFFDFKILFSIYFPFFPISICKFKYFLPWNASHFNFIK